jgi:hypothetical protein
MSTVFGDFAAVAPGANQLDEPSLVLSTDVLVADVILY